ncbi:MAG: hypothetical protein LBQ05_01175 [Christensenellaceae bacterium]|jgi:hypothetical protein|nr:hypothetical protein [Christensenellaceae bacterium]
MATRTRTTTDTVNVLNLLSYISVIAVGVILAIGHFFGGSGGYLGAIAQALAYIVISCYSWRFARRKGLAFIIPWVVAVVLIAIFWILPIIK